MPVGSSGKVREKKGRRVYVSWGGGFEGWYTLGVTVVKCRTAAAKGIEPWKSAFAPRPPRDPDKPYRPPDILNPGRG
jgi:hypothetical protein